MGEVTTPIAGLPVQTGSFVGTLTGCATAPTATFQYTRVNRTVTITLDVGLQAVSNAATCTVTGLPAALWPVRQQACIGRLVDNSGAVSGLVRVDSDGNITLGLAHSGSGGGFTASNNKGMQATSFTYSLN